MGFAGIVLLLLPLVPGLGVNINGARIWIRVAGFSFQPGEIAKICLAVFFAGYLVVKRDALALAGRRFARHRPATRPRPRPDPADVADQPRRPGLPATTSARRCCSSASSWSCCTSRPSGRAGWSSASGCSSPGRYFGYLVVRPRADPRRRLAAPVLELRRLLPDHPGPVRPRLGRHPRPRLGPGQPAADAVLAWTDFIGTSLGEELGLTGLMAIIVIYGADRRARSADRAGLPRPVRQAARRRPRRRRSRSRCSSSSAASPS